MSHFSAMTTERVRTTTTSYASMESLTLEQFRLHFPDLGCAVSSGCLDCPLPLCKHDDWSGYCRWKTQLNHRAIAAAWEETAGADKSQRVAAVAERFGVTNRTVWRALRNVALWDGEAGITGSVDYQEATAVAS